MKPQTLEQIVDYYLRNYQGPKHFFRWRDEMLMKLKEREDIIYNLKPGHNDWEFDFKNKCFKRVSK